SAAARRIGPAGPPARHVPYAARSKSHCRLIHGAPGAVNENGSARATARSAAISRPLARCHQVSGSSRVCTWSATTRRSAVAAPVVQETTVRGTPPDLAGRWLAVTWIELGQDTIRNVATPWDITERDGRLQLTELFVELAVVKEAIDKANAERAAWRPTREELARVLASW